MEAFVYSTDNKPKKTNRIIANVNNLSFAQLDLLTYSAHLQHYYPKLN